MREIVALIDRVLQAPAGITDTEDVRARGKACAAVFPCSMPTRPRPSKRIARQ